MRSMSDTHSRPSCIFLSSSLFFMLYQVGDLRLLKYCTVLKWRELHLTAFYFRPRRQFLNIKNKGWDDLRTFRAGGINIECSPICESAMRGLQREEGVPMATLIVGFVATLMLGFFPALALAQPSCVPKRYYQVWSELKNNGFRVRLMSTARGRTENCWFTVVVKSPTGERRCGEVRDLAIPLSSAGIQIRSCRPFMVDKVELLLEFAPIDKPYVK